jgi:hypothetical protein
VSRTGVSAFGLAEHQRSLGLDNKYSWRALFWKKRGEEGHMVKAVFVCCALLAGWLYQQPASSPMSTASLDFEYFKTRVQPIFLAKRPGHARCVSCHGSSTAPAIFHLQPLAPGSTTWTEEQSRKNFEVVSALVAPGSLQSPLLIHPLAEQAGGDFFHSGGKHFNSQNDQEWLTLKAWAFGAKAK